jgi:membrane protein implicated in regulation of membrane protease activity
MCRGHSLEISGKECLPGLTILLAALTLAALSALLAALTGLICLVLLSALLAAALLATLLTALVLLVRAFVRHAVPLSGVVQHHINRSSMTSVPEGRCGNVVHRAAHTIVPDLINSK